MSAGASAEVAHNLAQADHMQPMAANQHVGTTFEEGHIQPHIEPRALGLDATAWVALAMIVVIAIAMAKKVPAMAAAMLDKRIAGIRQQLDEASRLRAEAEGLRSEYEAKSAAAAGEADAIRLQAQHESAALVAKARLDADALITRRARMAEDKIGAAEAAAIAQVRTKAAEAAARAAASILTETHGVVADKALVDRTISRLN